MKPKALRKGDTIGLIAPSSPISDTRADNTKQKIERSVAALNQQGFNVVVDKSCYLKYGYLSGTDAERAEGVNRMFADRNVDAVFCIRGGYGTPRILDKIDYENIKKNPKLFLGYSDITALHIAINKFCGLVTVHGAMPGCEMINTFPPFTRESYLKAVTATEPLGELKNPAGAEVKCLVPGRAEGEIIGGNLSLITAAIGTPYEIDAKGKILFIEDIGEYTYRVDRMLTQLRLAGKFDDCAGIVLGDFTDCKVEYGKRYGLPLLQVFEDIIAPAGKPTIYNFKAGHCVPTLSLPFGVNAVLDADNRSLTLTEAALV